VLSRERCVEAQEAFLKRCFYQAGPYDNPSGFKELNMRMNEQEASMPRSNRMFFLSIPPNVFIAAAGGAADFCSSK
jgi:glucose-6-phosphate 1-dehydrogenase